jgi:cysteinyl-tRNA synthetase
MKLLIYNTESRKKEEVVPADGKCVRLYTCGPTVYDYAHIGNFRTFVFEDLLRRAITFFGMPVKQVMNLTDVDDKTIRGAIKHNIELDAYTKPFKLAFFEDLKTLNVMPADAYPEATQYISRMIEMIQELKNKGFAYTGLDGSVYFSIARFPGYGKLSHLQLEELEEGASERVERDEYTKESAADFVLWKSYDPSRDGTIYWESPFGRGRPGWHIECSVMAERLLGETIDIHAGGVDLIFPHHENEIAQSEACHGKCFARMWVHAEHLLVDHKKMSKSLGNFYTLRDILNKGYSGRVLRFLFLQNHYRMQMNFTLQALDAAKATLARIDDFISRITHLQCAAENGPTLEMELQEAENGFKKALADDLNVSEALSFLFDFIRKANSQCDQKKLTQKDKEEILSFFKQLNQVLGCLQFEEEEIPFEVQELAKQRTLARVEKRWKESDELRQEILARGYICEDTSQGQRLKKRDP